MGLQTAPAQEGEIIAGKYRVERVLGAGGMGVVVAALHLQLKQRVAIKFLLDGGLASQEAVTRFLREAEAAARIQSEHVARVLDVASLEDGTPYMVMEFLQGSDLAELLKQRGPMPVEEAVGYMLQACEGIAEAHAAGIVHRDLKPSNFFLCEYSGRTVLKVLDFGISKTTDGDRAAGSLTQSSAFMGSPLYMSPEQMASAKHVDQRTDIWSTGVTLFELVSGKIPFEGASITEFIAKVLQEAPRPISDFRADLPSGFAAALGRALEKDRARRYSDIGQFAQAIAPFGPRYSDAIVERIRLVLGASRLELEATQRAPGELAAVAAASAGGGTTAKPVMSEGETASVATRPRSVWALPLIATAAVLVGGFVWSRQGGQSSGSETQNSALASQGPATESSTAPALSMTAATTPSSQASSDAGALQPSSSATVSASASASIAPRPTARPRENKPKNPLDRRN